MIFNKTINKIKKFRQIKLSKEEADQMFADFSRITGMEAKPIVSEYFVFSWQRYASYATLVLFLGLSTLSYAAEGALPGDILYPIKIKVNESVIRKVSSTDAEVAILERRFDEAKKLRDKGELKDEIKILVRENVFKQLSIASPEVLDEIEQEDQKENGRSAKSKVNISEPAIMMMSAELAPSEDEREVEVEDNEIEDEDSVEYKSKNNNDKNDEQDEKKDETKKDRQDKVKDIIKKHKEIFDEIDNLDDSVDIDL